MKAMRRKYSISRERSCDIPLADDSVSGHHAELEFLEDGKWLLTDCQSTNGTFLLGNGGAPRRLSQSLVSPLDRVRFGSMTLVNLVLQSHDLPPIRARVAGHYDGEQGFLPGLIDLCILQFLASRSVDQTVSVLNSSLELLMHRVDLRYTLPRYLTWVIPTVGFIGTVVGIALALAMIDPSAAVQPLGAIARALGVSFYTTLVALVDSAILVLLLQLVQAREELAVNAAGHYVLVNLINRLYSRQ